MTCRDAITMLADYLDATLPDDTGERMVGHLRGCDACQAYLATYQRTREVAAQAQRVEMPEELKARLRVFLLSELRDESP